MDLFENFEQQPKNLAKICDKYLTGEGLNYKKCADFLKECEAIGYTFEYGLDAEPINLKKI